MNNLEAINYLTWAGLLLFIIAVAIIVMRDDSGPDDDKPYKDEREDIFNNKQ